jgi:hypothetical protein
MASAHPGWGITIGTNGDIYFSDILHNGTGTVWKLDQEGNVTIVLTDFHAHDLQMDAEGNLWVAEDRWIQGVVEGEGEQTLLKISPDGKKETIIFTDDRDDFFGGSFALSNHNSVYFTRNKKIWERPFMQEARLLFDYKFERLVTIYTDPDFNLWITDKGHKQGTLFKWNSEDGLVEYATGLLPVDPENPIFEEERFHLLYGITRGDDGVMYVTENSGRNVLQISADGEITTFYTSNPKWYPAGIAFYKGDAYMMEIGYDQFHLGPRIIRMDKSGELTILFDYEQYKKRQ